MDPRFGTAESPSTDEGNFWNDSWVARVSAIGAGLSPLATVVLGVVVLILLPTGAADAKKKPEWVDRGGVSSKYPSARFVTGFGMGTGDEALAQAKQMASADLASRISVRIESELSDIASQSDGEYSYKVAAVTRVKVLQLEETQRPLSKGSS